MEKRMVISTKDQIEHIARKNLLRAHKRICEQGNAKEIIKFSKYIFSLAKKGEDEVIDLGFEKQQKNAEDPPNKS